MAEHSILFRADMVRAILDGRKMQTRRVPTVGNSLLDGHSAVRGGLRDIWNGLDWALARVDQGPSPAGNVGPYWHVPYPAEHTVHRVYCRYGPGDRLWVKRGRVGGKKDAVAWLSVVSVGAERVQEISLAECVAEGMDLDYNDKHIADFNAAEKAHSAGLSCGCRYPEIYPFRVLWDSINAKRGFGWAQNPFVWVVSFERIKP